MATQAEKIRRFIRQHLEKHPDDIAALTRDRFGVSHMTVHRHLNKLIQQGEIIKSGNTSGTRYFPAQAAHREIDVSIDPKPDEFNLWTQYFEDTFSVFSKNINEICHYGFTEMLNNAKDHSLGKKIRITFTVAQNNLHFMIADDGIGIFEKIRSHMAFDNIRDSIVTLSKGKFTTDPQNHTGQGIFFTSRVFDRFIIHANQLTFIRDNAEDDWQFYSDADKKKGTCIELVISKKSTRDLGNVFSDYSDPETYEFDKSDIKVILLCHSGEDTFISRSQAKLLLHGLDRFKELVFDFQDVRTVGQGFVDQIFRVFQNQHPDIQIRYHNANEDVRFMIERGKTKNN